MSEEVFNVTLTITDWVCDACGTYCKPTGNIKKEFVGVKIEHMCMNPNCGQTVELLTSYPKWDHLPTAIANGRPKNDDY